MHSRILLRVNQSGSPAETLSMPVGYLLLVYHMMSKDYKSNLSERTAKTAPSLAGASQNLRLLSLSTGAIHSLLHELRQRIRYHRLRWWLP
jgi:hypothetical protein